MASVAYNFMVVDANSHSHRYIDNNSSDNRKPNYVSIDFGVESSQPGNLTRRRRSKRKSASVCFKEKVSVIVLHF